VWRSNRLIFQEAALPLAQQEGVRALVQQAQGQRVPQEGQRVPQGEKPLGQQW